MASTIKEVVKVDRLGKWGPKVGNEYYSWSKNIKEADKGKVVPGGTYDCDIYVADSGKKYINSVLGSNVNNPMPKIIAPVFANTPVVNPNASVSNKLYTPKTSKKSDEMSKDEWAAKDRRISRQGCIQVAVQVTSNFDEAVVLAEKMLAFVNQ